VLSSGGASGADTMIVVVPTISRFYGIAIQMFFKEHGVPHFHARYGARSRSSRSNRSSASAASCRDPIVIYEGLPPLNARAVRGAAA
jgi:hypothetical protein